MRGSDGDILDLMLVELSVDTAHGAYNAILKLVNIGFPRKLARSELANG